MEFTGKYNGKKVNFYIKAKGKEREFIQPYFIKTSIDKTRSGRIYNMNVLFSYDSKSNIIIYDGTQGHGYGYSFSADVYGELIEIIKQVHKKRLTAYDLKQLEKINTHDDAQHFTPKFLENLKKYNNEALAEKWSK